MRRLALRALRAAALLCAAVLALELLLPLFAGPALDPPPLEHRRARAFHRALFRTDRSTLEALRAEAFLCQAESAALGSASPGPDAVGIEIRTNAHGLRMRACALDRAPERLRIAVLGDSVSFGWRVREAQCWPRVLEERLRSSAVDVEVLNFAVPGFSTAQAEAQLRSRVLAFAPQLVILATGFNDAWLRPGPDDGERLRRAAGTSELALALFTWRRESAVLRAGRRWLGLDEPGTPDPGAALLRRLPSAAAEAALTSAVAICRGSGAEIVLADLCLPHARAGDVLRAVAARSGVELFDGRACLGHERREPAPLAERRRFEVALDTGLRERWDGGRDALLALAFPPDRVTGVGDLELRPLVREGARAVLELEAGAARDWAFLPRSYLDAAPRSLERLMTLVYHRVPDAAREHELRAGRFAGAAYDCSDAPHAAFAHGEAIHPSAEGHALLAAACARFLLDRPHLLEKGRATRGRHAG